MARLSSDEEGSSEDAEQWDEDQTNDDHENDMVYLTKEDSATLETLLANTASLTG